MKAQLEILHSIIRVFKDGDPISGPFEFAVTVSSDDTLGDTVTFKALREADFKKIISLDLRRAIALELKRFGFTRGKWKRVKENGDERWFEFNL